MTFAKSLVALLALSAPMFAANPPVPAPEFAVPQSPAKPVPFAINYVDQGKYDARLKGLLAPEGFQVELVADEKATINPVGLTFGPDGTLFVLEWSVDPITGNKWFEFKETFRYRDGSTKQVATMRKFTNDPVKVLKPNSAGFYDKAETIISEELPSTLLYHDGWLYTTGRGTVRRYKQSRQNGPWDLRETIAQGFCGFHHHQVSGLTIGLDGKLYITSGDDDNFVEGSDGSRANVLRAGAVFRCNPDGSQMETFSLGYRNPYRDIAYDNKYNYFHADNDNEDGSKFTGCRLVHVAEEADYGWRLKQGARCCRPDFTRGAVAGELPGKLPPMLKTGRGSPAGVLIYHDTYLPEQYRGLMYYPDVFRKNVRAYKLHEQGSSFQVTHEFEFLKANDDPLFRPCQMVTGPDGAIYVCDWRTDSGGAGRLSGDGKNGRIYRMRWIGTPTQPAIPLRGMDSWAKIIALPTPELVSQLDSPNLTDRVEARKELVRRGAPARDKVLKRLVSGKLSDAGRIEALGVLEPHFASSPAVADLFRLLLNDESTDIRRLVIEAIGRRTTKADVATREALSRMALEEQPSVRRAAALALGRIGFDGTADLLINAWRTDDGKDPFLSDALVRGLERLGKPGMTALLAVAKSGSKIDLDRVAAAFLTFRSESAVNALPEILTDPHLPAAERANLLRSYSNYLFDPPMPMDAVTKFVTTRPDEPAAVKIAGVEVLSGTGQLGDAKAANFVLAQLDSADVETRQAALDAISEARLTQATAKLITLLNDTKRPMPERLNVLKALRSTAGNAAAKPLLDLLNRPEPTALKVEAIRALATASPEEARQVAVTLLNQPEAALINEAIILLGVNQAGAKIIGEQFVAKKLPREFFPRVSETLQKFQSDAVIAKLYGEVMKGGLLVSLDPVRLEETKKLVAAKGDAARGKLVYLNTKLVACASCHRMEGVGGAVGPDLTRLWDTHTVEKILESIIDPNKEIKEGYQSYKAVTISGQVFTGLKITETAQAVTLREATGRDVRILKTDLDELNTTKISLMPDNAISQLSFEQFLDLLAFLKSKASQESLRGVALDYQVVVAQPVRLSTKAEWEAKPASIPMKLLQAATAEPDGLLDVKPFFPAGKASGAYAITYLYTAKPQTVKLKITADDSVRVMVGDKVAFEQKEPIIPYAKPVNTEVTVNLPAGWSPVVVKLATNAKSTRLGLQVTGDGIRIAAKPE
jgi:quinoprotein glucose dehydrogenase